MGGYTPIDNDIIPELLKMPGRTTDVYLALLSHRNQRTKLCNPSQETIAEECGLYVRTVRRLIKELRDAGLLTYISRTSRHGKSTNEYYFSTGRGQERPVGRGQERPGYRSGETSPKDRSGETSKQYEVNKTKAIAYCKKNGHNWADLGDTLHCGRCDSEQPNNVIPIGLEA